MIALKAHILSFMLLQTLVFKTQVANHIANGGFEQYHNCNPPYYGTLAKHWMSIDSGLSYSGEYANVCNGAIPNQGNTIYQYPKTGNAFLITNFYCNDPVCGNQKRSYIKNRMKAKLVSGKTYCVKFYINITNFSPYGSDGFGAYFGDNTIDTITKSNIPLTYLTPQVQNPNGNIITDTLGWVAVTGTFVATGIEKYCLLGNFKTDMATNIATINPLYLPQKWTDLCIDDVSCIPIDLPAFAGADIFGIPGNTVYIGRPQDVGIDEACLWYNLTNTTTPIANAAGFTHTVAAITQTYMVKQDICGVIKYDTVVVYASAVSINNVTLSGAEAWFKVFPNPANEILNVELKMINEELSIQNLLFIIYNSLGQVIKKEKLEFKNNTATITTKELPNGVYTLQIKTEYGTLNKKIVIER